MASSNPRFLSQSDSVSGGLNAGKVTPPHEDTASKSATCEEREKLAKSCEAYAEEYRKEERERFKMYEAEFTQELMAKYFSNKDIFGDDIIEDKTVVDGETVKASRWLGTESYADPVKYLELKGSSISASDADSPTSIGKQSTKKSG